MTVKGGSMQVMYMRFDVDNADWLADESRRTGLSMARIANEIINTMRREGWAIEPAKVSIGKPASDEKTSQQR
jgi:hypothetical protein